MAYLKNWTDNFFQIFVMGTSWVAVSINNITTRASKEMTSRKNIKIFDFNGVNVAKHWHVAGEYLPSLIALLFFGCKFEYKGANVYICVLIIAKINIMTGLTTSYSGIHLSLRHI